MMPSPAQNMEKSLENWARNGILFDIGPKIKEDAVQTVLSDVCGDNVFLIDPDPEHEDLLRIHIGGTTLPVSRYANVGFVAREAALRVLEVLGDATPETLAFVIGEGVIDGISGVIVKFNTADLRISEEVMRELQGFDLSVIERILTIAEEIRDEGREGRKVGTLFVVGDPGELQQYAKQLVLNPFKGYPPEERNILSEDIKETIKEFAQLDGAFLISRDGTVISAGTYIDVDASNVRRYPGWGTRHVAAAAITTNTDSVAVLVSESGGRIKLFRKGRIIMRR